VRGAAAGGLRGAGRQLRMRCITQAMSAGFQLVHFRPYGDDDEPGVLELLQAAFGRWPRRVEDQDPEDAFRWKHLANPAGRSLMVVAEVDGRLVGFAAWMPWRVTAGATVFEVLRAVDVAVDRRYRGQRVYAGAGPRGDPALRARGGVHV